MTIRFVNQQSFFLQEEMSFLVMEIYQNNKSPAFFFAILFYFVCLQSRPISPFDVANANCAPYEDVCSKYRVSCKETISKSRDPQSSVFSVYCCVDTKCFACPIAMCQWPSSTKIT
ncbi:uncharacterized protein ASCRUDRAFT_154735 [Ascoidea rubescens DSM 1968]|uniref:Uncharacterized protein n=1 Tax=Ascoidea rubescens DSM 1968 TaxID=1344418 RepID=A0A1D2VG66_9ASCO|nr:hypothetical protein ASCRUDRAFT_154735 [Ascoidea rubescens DSM 1968]ODV60520.1 hypothetical protein ASCRUDRAFT_154735 [Ascoidea rubescens DSM 1968]